MTYQRKVLLVALSLSAVAIGSAVWLYFGDPAQMLRYVLLATLGFCGVLGYASPRSPWLPLPGFPKTT